MKQVACVLACLVALLPSSAVAQTSPHSNYAAQPTADERIQRLSTLRKNGSADLIEDVSTAAATGAPGKVLDHAEASSRRALNLLYNFA